MAKKGKTEELETPDLPGFTIAEAGEGKWFAVRITTRGGVEFLNPKRGGEMVGESPALAIQRAREAFEQHCRNLLRPKRRPLKPVGVQA